jgi:rRNA maturation endonuclease Nob1
MPYICKNPSGKCIGKVNPQETKRVYDDHKRCSVCEMYVDKHHQKCPCCGSPLRSKSKRNRKIIK